MRLRGSFKFLHSPNEEEAVTIFKGERALQQRQYEKRSKSDQDSSHSAHAAVLKREKKMKAVQRGVSARASKSSVSTQPPTTSQPQYPPPCYGFSYEPI